MNKLEANNEDIPLLQYIKYCSVLVLHRTEQGRVGLSVVARDKTFLENSLR